MDNKIFCDINFANPKEKELFIFNAIELIRNSNWKELYIENHNLKKERIESIAQLKENLVDNPEIFLLKCIIQSNIINFQFWKNGSFRLFAYCDNLLDSFSIDLIHNYQIKYAYFNNYLDISLQNNFDLKFWVEKKVSIPSYIEYIPAFDFHDPDAKQISKESLPGHIHKMNYAEELLFGSFCQMYFGEIYYKYIPRPLFEDFIGGSENIILSNGVRKISLFDNFLDYGKIKNIEIRWAFRRNLGIDSIAHELIQESNRKELVDLPVEITKKNLKIGATRVTRYLDNENKLINPIRATIKEIKEYDEIGENVVWEERYLLNKS